MKLDAKFEEEKTHWGPWRGHSPHTLLPTRVRNPQKCTLNGVIYVTKFATLNGVIYVTKFATLNGVTHEKSYPKWRKKGKSTNFDALSVVNRETHKFGTLNGVKVKSGLDL